MIFMAFLVAKVSGLSINFIIIRLASPLLYYMAGHTVCAIRLHGMPSRRSPALHQETVSTSVPGDVVLLMRNGLAELFNPAHEQMGDAQIKEYIQDTYERSAGAL